MTGPVGLDPFRSLESAAADAASARARMAHTGWHPMEHAGGRTHAAKPRRAVTKAVSGAGGGGASDGAGAGAGAGGSTRLLPGQDCDMEDSDSSDMGDEGMQWMAAATKQVTCKRQRRRACQEEPHQDDDNGMDIESVSLQSQLFVHKPQPVFAATTGSVQLPL